MTHSLIAPHTFEEAAQSVVAFFVEVVDPCPLDLTVELEENDVYADLRYGRD